MATLTSTQRADMQADLAIGLDQGVFTDDALDRLYTRAGGDYDATVLLGWRQLAAKLAGETDYRAGETEERRSQRYAHVMKMIAYWEERVAGTAITSQAVIVGSRAVPPREKDKPVSG